MMTTKAFYFCVTINAIVVILNLASLIILGNLWAIVSIMVNGAVIGFLYWRRQRFLEICKETIGGWEQQSNT